MHSFLDCDCLITFHICHHRPSPSQGGTGHHRPSLSPLPSSLCQFNCARTIKLHMGASGKPGNIINTTILIGQVCDDLPSHRHIAGIIMLLFSINHSISACNCIPELSFTPVGALSHIVFDAQHFQVRGPVLSDLLFDRIGSSTELCRSCQCGCLRSP